MRIIKRVLKKIMRLKISQLLPDKIYLKIMYRLSYNKRLNLKKPTLYNEKIQWLKLYNRDESYCNLVDKYEVKKYISEKIGSQYIIKTIGLYKKYSDIDFNKLPSKFVIKCTHDSGGIVIIRNKEKMDFKKTKKIIQKSLKTNYYYKGREWPYKKIKPRIIIEEYVEINKNKNISDSKIIDCDTLQSQYGLLDYKFMCFNGKVMCLFLDIGVIGKGTGHSTEYYRNVYDRNFKLLPVLETRKNFSKIITPPENFKKMISLAEKISEGIPHVRVDLYNIQGNILFGEMTFFHGSGLSNHFIPEKYNELFGSYIDINKIKMKNYNRKD